MCKKREAYEWHSSACFIPVHVHIPHHAAMREKLNDPNIRQSFYLDVIESSASTLRKWQSKGKESEVFNVATTQATQIDRHT